MKDLPEKIYNVSQTQFSIARHYGGIRFNGVFYFYDRANDSLIREDVFKSKNKKGNSNAPDEPERSSGMDKQLFD